MLENTTMLRMSNARENRKHSEQQQTDQQLLTQILADVAADPILNLSVACGACRQIG
jgi:hypothetical protein